MKTATKILLLVIFAFVFTIPFSSSVVFADKHDTPSLDSVDINDGVSTEPTGEYEAFGDICERNGADKSAVCSEERIDNPIFGESGVLLQVVDIIALVAGSIAVIMIIISGIRFVTSSGDSNGINSAKNTIIMAFIGLGVIILGRFIITFIATRL